MRFHNSFLAVESLLHWHAAESRKRPPPTLRDVVAAARWKIAGGLRRAADKIAPPLEGVAMSWIDARGVTRVPPTHIEFLGAQGGAGLCWILGTFRGKNVVSAMREDDWLDMLGIHDENTEETAETDL